MIHQKDGLDEQASQDVGHHEVSTVGKQDCDDLNMEIELVYFGGV